MANEQLIEAVMAQVMQKVGGEVKQAPGSVTADAAEFVGANPLGSTIGLVIANIDPALQEAMKLDSRYRSIGIVSARTGAGPHIFAADEGVKATNSEVLSIELPRDTQGGAGHGSLIIFGAEDVSDARRAVEVTLEEVTRTFGDVYSTEDGHLELQYTARASGALNKAFNAPIGRAFGISVGAPAGIGVVMADTANKAAEVDMIGYASPNNGTSLSNEAIGFFSGDSGAVRQAIIAARGIGLKLLGAMSGVEPQSAASPYI